MRTRFPDWRTGPARSLVLLLLATTATAGLAAASLPTLQLPEGVGVNIHFTRGHTQDLDLLAAAGFTWIRMDFSWSGTERKPGEYDWSAYEELTDNLEQRGLRALYILDYSNSLYEEAVVTRDPVFGRESRSPAAPRHAESVAAFARWAAAAARHFRGRDILWEVWNEPNIGFWRPKPDVREYATLLTATIRAVRDADPTARLAAPASSEFPWEFLERLFGTPGILDGLDAVSVHPYRGQRPETVVDDYVRLRALIEQHAPTGKRSMPILSGEWGYSSSAGGVPAETQAAYFARQQLINLWCGIPLSIWYDWKNDGTDPKEREHNFGTVTHDLQLKPAYRAVQTLTRELNHCRIVRRLDTASAEDYLLLLVNTAGNQKLAAWTTRQPHLLNTQVDVPSPETVSVTDGQGARQRPEFAAGRLALALTGAPQYVTLKKPSRFLSAAAAWRIADPVPTRVVAGPTNRVALDVRLDNPFDRPVAAELVLRSGDEPSAIPLELAPGQSLNRTLVWPVTRRGPEHQAWSVHVTYTVRGPTSGEVYASSDHRWMVIGNPLVADLAPVDGGLRLTLQDPSRTGFQGRLRVGGQDHQVRIEPGQSEWVYLLPPMTRNGSQPQPLLLEHPNGMETLRIHRGRFEPLAVGTLQAALDGDSTVAAQAALVRTNAPADSDRPFSQAYRLDYQFDPGWRFVRCAFAGSPTVPLPEDAAELGLWVRGDGSGNTLRVRLRDETGQTFQLNGPRLNWTNWRWVAFGLHDLGAAGHWGGANDGIPRGRLMLDTLLLIDGTREKTDGTVYLAGPTVVIPDDPD